MTVTGTVRPRSTGHPGYSATMPRVPEAAAEARVLARVALGIWGLDRAADEAALLLTELVSNAVRHARGPDIEIAVDRPTPDRVQLAVADRAPDRLPELLAAGPDDVRGRGLRLIDNMADRWGYDRVGSSKRVWADLDVNVGTGA